MKEYVKAYNMFLAGRYMKYIIYLLMPVLVIGASGIMLFVFPVQAVIPIAALYIFWGEIMLEGWSFRAIAKKKNYNLEYLKTSAKWRRLLWKALIFDSIRRFISTSLILSVVFFLLRTARGKEGEGITVVALLVYILFTCFFGTLFLGITRRTENVYVNLFVIYFAAVPCWMAAGVVYSYMGNLLGVVIWGMLFAAAAAFDIRHIIKRIGGSFYDE